MNAYTLQDAILEGKDIANDKNEFYKAESKKFNEMLENLCLKDIFESLYKENEIYKISELGKGFVNYLLSEYSTQEGKKIRTQNKVPFSFEEGKEEIDYISFLKQVTDKVLELLKENPKKNSKKLLNQFIYHPLYFISKQNSIKKEFQKLLEISNPSLMSSDDKIYLLSRMERELNDFVEKWDTIYSLFDEMRFEEIASDAKIECEQMSTEENLAIELLWILVTDKYKNDENYKRILKENDILSNKVTGKKQLLKNKELLAKIESEYLDKEFELFISDKNNEERTYFRFIYDNWIKNGKVFKSDEHICERLKSPQELFELVLKDIESN